MIKKPKNDMFRVIVEGWHRDKAVTAVFHRREREWIVIITVDGRTSAPISTKGDKPCWATAKHVIDRRGLIAKAVPASRTERRVAASKRADARQASKDQR